MERRSQVKVDKLENSAKVCSTVQVTRELQNKETLFLTLSDWQKSKCDPLTTAGKEMGKASSRLLLGADMSVTTALRAAGFHPSLLRVLTPWLRVPFHS